MKKVKYNDSYIYIDDTPLDENETGIKFNKKDNDEYLDKTMKIEAVDNSLLNDTVTNLWGEEHE